MLHHRLCCGGWASWHRDEDTPGSGPVSSVASVMTLEPRGQRPPRAEHHCGFPVVATLRWDEHAPVIGCSGLYSGRPGSADLQVLCSLCLFQPSERLPHVICVLCSELFSLPSLALKSTEFSPAVLSLSPSSRHCPGVAGLFLHESLAGHLLRPAHHPCSLP